MLRAKTKAILARSAETLLAQRDALGWWSFPAHLGSHYISVYALFLEWLRWRGFSSRLDLNHLAAILLQTQLPDGSWKQARDPALASGDINATVFNYAALKCFRSTIASADVRPALVAARSYILQAGGIDATNQFSKTFLALFCLRGWDEIPEVPYPLFWEMMPVNYRGFSQWVIPHLLPIAYLRHNRVSRKICGTFGPEFDLDELYTGVPWKPVPRQIEPSAWHNAYIVRKLLEQQRSQGSWGGYTVSSLLSIAALDHFCRLHPGRFPAVPAAIQRGVGFVEALYFNHGEGNYRGCLMYGGIWDSILAAQALLHTGRNGEPLLRAAQLLGKVQTPEGGFPFGQDFEAYPDVDDTSRALDFLEQLARHTRQPGNVESRKRGVHWLLKRQNSDGGWGAFDKDNVGNRLIRRFTRHLSDSVELFDASSADNTGHVLKALGTFGLTALCRPVRKAMDYLRRVQDRHSGLWQGRWGVNTLYGTAQAGVGLLCAGESPQAPYLQLAAQTLIRLQNSDGGFGETTLSYKNPELWGRGVSTPSQTAWVLEFLLEMGLAATPVAERAVQYLLETWSGDGLWRDEVVVGTGHPGILYVEYPVYPKTFPLMALARYLRATC